MIASGPVGGSQPQIDRFVVRDKGDLRPDAFADELFLLLRGEKGWCVLTGCCHRGLANTLRTARFLARGEPIATVIGGFHLGHAGEEQLADAALALHEVDPAGIYTGHCTGQAGKDFLSRHFPGRMHSLHSGLRLRL